MTVSRDLYSGLNVTQLVDPVVLTGDTNSASIDTRGYDSLMLVVNVGESGDTLSGSVLWDLEIEDSPDDSVWTDATDAQITNAVTGTNTGTFARIDAAAEDDAVYFTGYRGDQRYVRVVINATGTHATGTPMSVTALQGHAHIMPVNASDDL